MNWCEWVRGDGGGAPAAQLAAALRRLPAEGQGRVNDIMQTDPAFPGSEGRVSLSQLSDRVLHRIAAQIQTEQASPPLDCWDGSGQPGKP